MIAQASYYERKVGRAKLIKGVATIGAAATATVLLNAGGAQAQGDGGLLSILGNSPLVQVCYPMGQVGQGNTFTGTQNINCSQNTTTQAGTGDSGVTGAQIATGVGLELGPNESGEDSAICDEGQVVTGGGYLISASTLDYQVIWSRPYTLAGERQPRAWSVYVVNEGQQPITVETHAVCIDAAQ